MKVQIFTDNSISDLQKEVNQWLEENQGAQIIHVQQSESNTSFVDSDEPQFNWGVTISIWYE